MNLTPQELETLYTARSFREWNLACEAIKRAHAGNYPADWEAVVLNDRRLSLYDVKMALIEKVPLPPGALDEVYQEALAKLKV